MQQRSLDALTRRVTEHFRKHAKEFGLNHETVSAHYILNMGGFVNASFQITDGQQSYHLKLADDQDALDRLIRWEALNNLLNQRYHAPRMIRWIHLSHSPFEGPLFEYIAGREANLTAQPEVLRGVLDLLAQLHSDRSLADELYSMVEGGMVEGEVGLDCSGYFLSVYIDRFDSDLLTIAGDLPPFVPLDLLSWMMGETRELEGLARDLPAFRHPADSPTHGDLWPSNILVTEAGSWYIIDWDDLSLGDPALEYSILFGPLWQQEKMSLEQIQNLLPGDADFRERFSLCLRALVLDQVIDTLADWVECDFAPQHKAEVRAAKEKTHREALALYHQLYG